MRLLLALLSLGSAAHVTAQLEQAASLPACAISCLTTNIAVTTCPLTDVTCICNDKKLTDAVAACTLQSCTVREGLTAAKVSAEQCGLEVRDRGPQIKAITFSCFSIVWVFLLTRLATRSILKVGVLGLDDLFVFLAGLCTGPGLASTLSLAKYGFGRDIWAIDFDNIDKLLFWFWIGQLNYVWTTAFLKLSLLFFYMRIFNSTSLKKWIWAGVGIQSAFGIAFTLTIIFQCTPISEAWSFWEDRHSSKCININAASWALAVLTIVMDVLVLALPIRELWKLKMNIAKKIYIMVMFGLGSLVTIISILRLHSLISFANTYNLTYDSYPAMYWSVFEGFFGVVALCLPAFKPFLGAIAPSIFGSRSGTARSTPMGTRNSAFGRLSRSKAKTPMASSSQPEYASAETPSTTGTNVSADNFNMTEKLPSHSFDIA